MQIKTLQAAEIINYNSHKIFFHMQVLKNKLPFLSLEIMKTYDTKTATNKGHHFLRNKSIQFET